MTARRARPRHFVAGSAVVLLALAACSTSHAPTSKLGLHITVPQVAPSVAPTPKVAPIAVAAAPPHAYVPAGVPTSFELTGPKFTIKAHVCSMPPVFPLDPPGEQHHTVCWVTKGFGVKPGSATATSYVVGHSWAEDDQEVLNKASTMATREILTAHPQAVDGVPTYPAHALDGYRLILRTGQGVLTYTVTDTFGVAKNQAGFVKQIVDQKVPHRIVLITCAERKGRDYDDNVVIYATLTSSVRTLAAQS